jgi:hypothetical protein
MQSATTIKVNNMSKCSMRDKKMGGGMMKKKREAYMSGGKVTKNSVQELEMSMCKGNKDSSSRSKEY